MLNEWVLQHVPGSVGDQSSLRHRVFVRSVVRIGFFAGLQDSLTLLRTQQLKQLREVVRLKRLPYFLDLAESVRLDFLFNRIFRGVLQQGVTRIEFEVAGDVTKADDNRTAKGVCLTISHERSNRPQHFSLVLGLHAGSGQDDVRIEMPGNFIRHDLECALRLGLVERQTKLIEAMRADLPALDPALRLFDQHRFFLFSQRKVLLLFRSFDDPLRMQSLRLPGEKFGLVLVLEFPEQRLRDPSPAIVGAKFMVIDHHDAAIWFLDENLARGHQDSEVGDGGLRREAKSFRKLLFEGTLDRVELTVLGAAASSHQAVANAINLDSGQRLLDHGPVSYTHLRAHETVLDLVCR